MLAERDLTTSIRYINNLGTTGTSRLRAWTESTDQTLHWADPKGEHMMDSMNTAHYLGPIPAVAHLHGGEVPAELDGGPDAWFTSDRLQPRPRLLFRCRHRRRQCRHLQLPQHPGSAPIWFHDHALGVTRLNVYAGLAGAYLITDPALTSRRA